MKNLTLSNIARVCRGHYRGREELLERCVASIATDSRKAESGCLFVPIVGARVDGHDFIGQVMEAGALCTLSERELPGARFPYILVESSLQAVKDIAAFYLQQLRIPVVGITGSVGKTSTKEMIASVLAQKYRVLKTRGNFNNELGLPLTVFRLRETDQIAVLEMGISDFGEMSRLAHIARPDTCVITNIGCCHLEQLGDRDGVYRAKTEVFDFLKENGHVILNGDDDKLQKTGLVKGSRPLFFGVHSREGIYADEIENKGFAGISCRIHVDDKASVKVQIPVPGLHMVYNALAGASVGRLYGLTLEEIKAGIESMETISGRFHVIEQEEYTVIDDCYNANPASMKASLEVLGQVSGRTVAVLGDMGELGCEEESLHREVGAFAAAQGIDVLLCVGPLCRQMAQAAKEAAPTMQVLHCEDLHALLEILPQKIEKGDTLLVKASHFMQFEKVVEALVH